MPALKTLAFSDLFSRLSGRKEEPEAPDSGSETGRLVPTKALARFLAGLSTRPQPVLLDLGPVVGSNVTFFGERLGCKIFVEDLYADIDRHVREGKVDAFATFFATRFPQADGSVDGILCWDVFDYVDRGATAVLAQQLTRILRPDGVLLAFFNTAEPKDVPPAHVYTKHIVVDAMSLRQRPYPAARGKQKPLLNRNIERMFGPLRVAEQFLLKHNLREVLFRKPAAAAPHASDSPAGR